jgi:hypothetical protein
MPISTIMGVTASMSVSTTAALTQLDLVDFVPPPVTFPLTPRDTNHQIRISLDNIFLSMQQFTMHMVTREYPYGMLKTGIQTNVSTYVDNAIVFTPYDTDLSLGSSMPGRNALASFTIDSLNSLRKQMDENNHEMVNMLTQQIVTVFNPLIQNTNQSYQALVTQMGRIADLFSPIQVRINKFPKSRITCLYK